MEKVSLPAKVISIGNITLGGTGKTPVCIYLAKRFSQAGRKVGISTRGYGRKSGAPTVITKNTNIATWKECGDEPLLFAASPHITAIAIERDKALGAALLVRDHSCDTVILDDGFQFVTLKRDYDIVLLDAAARLTCASFVPQPSRKDFRSQRLIVAARAHLAEAAETVRCRRLDHAIALTEPCRESAIESLSAGHFVLAGLPMPTFQESIRTPQGEFFPDFYWSEARLIGEADGASKYTDPAAIVKEKEREQYLRDRGYLFVRWLGKEIMGRPQEVVGRVARALDAARFEL